MHIKLADWACKSGFSPEVVRWARTGKMPAPIIKTNTGQCEERAQKVLDVMSGEDNE